MLVRTHPACKHDFLSRKISISQLVLVRFDSELEISVSQLGFCVFFFQIAEEFELGSKHQFLETSVSYYCCFAVAVQSLSRSSRVATPCNVRLVGAGRGATAALTCVPAKHVCQPPFFT